MIKASHAMQHKTFLWPVDLEIVMLDNMKQTILKVLSFSQDTKPKDLTLHFTKAKKKNCEELRSNDFNLDL